MCLDAAHAEAGTTRELVGLDYLQKRVKISFPHVPTCQHDEINVILVCF
jgi:hypothetical protein